MAGVWGWVHGGPGLVNLDMVGIKGMMGFRGGGGGLGMAKI